MLTYINPYNIQYLLFSFDNSFLTEEKKENLIQKLWQSQKYCDEIQASRIPGEMNQHLYNSIVQHTIINKSCSFDIPTHTGMLCYSNAT